MFVPVLTPYLERRAGGGGGGGGGGGRGGGSTSSSSGGGSKGSSSSGSSSGSSSSGSSSSGSSSSGGSRGPTVSVPGTSSGGSSSSKGITSTGNGGGAVSTLGSGAFSGRTVGGGTRSDIYGTRTYGSGYPGISGGGVAGRGFPYYFWPVTFGGAAGYNSASYYHDSDEYGNPSNSTRPGGQLMYFTVVSINTSTNTTLRIMSDTTTIQSLVASFQDKLYSCVSSSANNSGAPTLFPYYDKVPDNSTYFAPSHVIQYYRASSVALLLDSYNNTATYSGHENETASALPNVTDMALVSCANKTIGDNVPLVDPSIDTSSNGAVGLHNAGANVAGLAMVLLCLLNVL